MHFLNSSKGNPRNISLWLQIERRESADREPCLQEIYYETRNRNATVATALTEINQTPCKDRNGNDVAPIRWECSCLQKKCGACAMVINGVPRLACDSFLRDYKKTVRIEPLHKFPIIADLIVDRSILFDNLKELGVWIEEAHLAEKDMELVYEASKCLQCGCCLEVCPNFCCGQKFCGAAGFVPAAGVLTMVSKSQKQEMIPGYMEHIYEGCGKSYACKNICPAGIDTEHMLVHSNKIALWKKKEKKKKGEIT